MEIILVAVIVLVSLVAVFFMYQMSGGGRFFIKRAFGKTPLSTVEAVRTPGRYRLAGVARPADAEPPVSQASGRSYLARDLRIIPKDGSETGSGRSAVESFDFLLDDGTGVALVRAENGAVALDRDFEAPQTTLDKVPWVDRLLREGGYHNGSPETCKILIYEGVLQPGDRAGVIGHAEPADARAQALGASIVVRVEGPTKLLIRAEPPDA